MSHPQHTSIPGYIPFSEEDTIEAQSQCQADLSHGLAHLTTLVNEAHISEDERAYLLSTIIHVCHHIVCESRELKHGREDRSN